MNIFIRTFLFIVLAFSLSAAEIGWRPEGSHARGRRVEHFIRKAEAEQQAGKYKKAIKYYKKVENQSVNLRNRARAIVRQGDCYQKMDNPWSAYKSYRKALDEYASFVDFGEVVEKEIAIADIFYNGRKDHFLGMSFSTDAMAIEIYDHAVRVAPYAPKASVALYRSALLSARSEDYAEAITKLHRLLNRYPDAAINRQAQLSLAEVQLKSARAADGDGLLVHNAHRQLKRLIAQNSNDSISVQARTLLRQAAEIEGTRLLELAKFYQNPVHQRLPAVRRYLRQVVAQYPATRSARVAEDLLQKMEGKKMTSPATGSPQAASRSTLARSVNKSGAVANASGAKTKKTTPAFYTPAPAQLPENPDKWLLPVEKLGDPTHDQH